VSAPHDDPLGVAVDAFRAAVFESTRTRLAESQMRLGLKAALAALDAMPGPTCSNCAGDGMVWTHEGNVPCPACDGYGTTAALDALHPEPESKVHQPTVEKIVDYLVSRGVHLAAAERIEREFGAGNEERG
jgi:hypothetical protein